MLRGCDHVRGHGGIKALERCIGWGISNAEVEGYSKEKREKNYNFAGGLEMSKWEAVRIIKVLQLPTLQQT